MHELLLMCSHLLTTHHHLEPTNVVGGMEFCMDHKGSLAVNTALCIHHGRKIHHQCNPTLHQPTCDHNSTVCCVHQIIIISLSCIHKVITISLFCRCQVIIISIVLYTSGNSHLIVLCQVIPISVPYLHVVT